ncbi:MAG TPA: HEAT repeat domain-containing protein, partial [Vicinamibacterales bacterium]
DAAIPAVKALFSISERIAHLGLDATTMVHESLLDSGRRHVIAAAQDAPAEVRAAIARALAWVGDTEAARHLAALLADPDAGAEAAASLVRFGDAAIDVLVERLTDEESEVRMAAIGALGALGTSRATTPLIGLLQEPRTAIAACGALARIGDPEAFEPLLDLISHRDGAVRVAAVGALNAIGHPRMSEVVLPLMDDASPFVRESAVRIAGYFGYPEARSPIETLCSDRDEIVRVAALEALPYFDEAAAVPVLERALAGETPKARAAAVHALAKIESDTVTPLLVRALADRDAWVRYFAARALGERDGAAGREELLKLAEADSSPPVRVAALQALGSREPDLPLEPLLRAARDDNADIASAALLTLGRVPAAEATAAIRAAIRHTDPARRMAAAQALGMRRTPDAIADLEWIAAADPDAGVAACAVRTLFEIATAGGNEAPSAVHALVALLADRDRADAALAALARLPLHLVTHVADGLAHADVVVRRRTVNALARYRHPDATGFLARAFDDEDPGVRESAVDAVVRLGSRSFEVTLQMLASDDPSEAVRHAARSALAARRQGA